MITRDERHFKCIEYIYIVNTEYVYIQHQIHILELGLDIVTNRYVTVTSLEVSLCLYRSI